MLLRHAPGMSDAQAQNMLKRDFCSVIPKQQWVTDFTEFNLNVSKHHLSACIYIRKGEVAAHQMA